MRVSAVPSKAYQKERPVMLKDRLAAWPGTSMLAGSADKSYRVLNAHRG